MDSPHALEGRRRQRRRGTPLRAHGPRRRSREAPDPGAARPPVTKASTASSGKRSGTRSSKNPRSRWPTSPAWPATTCGSRDAREPIRRDRGRLGRLGRLGLQASGRGRAEGRAARGRTAAVRPRTSPSTSRRSSSSIATARPRSSRKTRPIQSIFEVCTEYNYDWFCNDLDEPYTTPADKPFQWIGRLRMTGGRTNVWGRVCLRFSDFDLKAADYDGYGAELAAQLQGPRALLRPGRGLRRRHRHGRGPRGSARRPLPAADGADLPGTPGPQSNQAEAGLDAHARRAARTSRGPRTGAPPATTAAPANAAARRGPTSTRPSRPWPTPLATGNCTLVSNAMVHKVLDRSGQRPGPRRALRRSQHARVARSLRPQRAPVRPDPGVGAHPAQLRRPPASERPRQLERRPGALPDRPRAERRRQRRTAEPSARAPAWTAPSGRPASTSPASATPGAVPSRRTSCAATATKATPS